MAQKLLEDVPLKKRNIQYSRNALKNIPETKPEALSIKLIKEEKMRQLNKPSILTLGRQKKTSQVTMQVQPNKMLRQTFISFKGSQLCKKIDEQVVHPVSPRANHKDIWQKAYNSSKIPDSIVCNSTMPTTNQSSMIKLVSRNTSPRAEAKSPKNKCSIIQN